VAGGSSIRRSRTARGFRDRTELPRVLPAQVALERLRVYGGRDAAIFGGVVPGRLLFQVDRGRHAGPQTAKGSASWRFSAIPSPGLDMSGLRAPAAGWSAPSNSICSIRTWSNTVAHGAKQ
jgi:hypothetical protein